jgi:hypothetical protein
LATHSIAHTPGRFVPRTVILFQPISAGIGKIVGAKYWIAFIMTGWGVFTLVHAWVKSEGMLIAFRLMIGV